MIRFTSQSPSKKTGLDVVRHDSLKVEGVKEDQETSQVWNAVWRSATDEEGTMQVPRRDRRKGR